MRSKAEGGLIRGASTRSRASRNGSAPRTPSKAKQQLEAEREHLFASLVGVSLAPDELAEGWQERDSPSEREIRDVEYSHRGATRQRLREIDEALERMRSAGYGLCTECGTKIERKRLASDPAVSLCLECRSRVEGEVVSVRH